MRIIKKYKVATERNTSIQFDFFRILANIIPKPNCIILDGLQKQAQLSHIQWGSGMYMGRMAQSMSTIVDVIVLTSQLFIISLH